MARNLPEAGAAAYNERTACLEERPMANRLPLPIVGTLIVLGFTASAPVSQARQQAQPPATPQFRTGTDIVTVDVTVLNRGGDPVINLKADDFLLTVDGRPRKVQSVRLLRSETGVPSLTEPDPNDPGGTGPRLTAARRFVLVIDREHIPVGEGQQMLAAAASFLDLLPPDDRVAVWTSTQTTSTVRFTENKEGLKDRIRASTGTYRNSFGPWNIGRDEAIRAVNEGSTMQAAPPDPNDPRSSAGVFIKAGTLQDIVNRECYQQPVSCPMEVNAQVQEVARDAKDRADVFLANLGNLIDALAVLDGPKHVVLVTGGPVFTPENMNIIKGLAARAAAARVIVHALQVRDPSHRARTDQMRAAPDTIDQNASAAYMLAGSTGGLAITPTAGEIGFKRLTHELSTAYLLAFEVEDSDRDAQVHQIDVQIRNASWGGVVRARKSFRVTYSARAAGAAAPVAAPAVPAAPAAPTPAPEPVGVDPGDMADRLADYVELFEQKITAVVAEERFVQIIQPWRATPSDPEKEPALAWVEPGERGPKSGPIIARRQLISDVLMVQLPGQAWQSYRDVAEVDGKPVRDRSDRVQRLFLSSGPERAGKFQEIALESSRYNLGDLKRDVNLPTVTLSLLRRANHSRFSFKRQKDETINGRPCRVLAYKETVRPTLISTRQSGDIYLYGRIWLDQADGRVRQTELRFDRGTVGAAGGAGGYRSYIRVEYDTAEGMEILVPRRMWEWYEGVNQLGRIGGDLTGEQGLASYSKFRKFQVSTDATVK
jgi:VWFA-related protein